MLRCASIKLCFDLLVVVDQAPQLHLNRVFRGLIVVIYEHAIHQTPAVFLAEVRWEQLDLLQGFDALHNFALADFHERQEES
jgi:hypothetical protein